MVWGVLLAFLSHEFTTNLYEVVVLEKKQVSGLIEFSREAGILLGLLGEHETWTIHEKYKLKKEKEKILDIECKFNIAMIAS